jgi:hypothetical protein
VGWLRKAIIGIVAAIIAWALSDYDEGHMGGMG